MAGTPNYFSRKLCEVLILLLYLAVMGSALLVIYHKFLSRNLFAEQQRQQQVQDAAFVEWSQLLLEQGAWAAQQRVAQMAGNQLKMLPPGPEDVVVIEP